MTSVLWHKHVSIGNAKTHVFMNNAEQTQNALLIAIYPNVRAYQDTEEILMIFVDKLNAWQIPNAPTIKHVGMKSA